MPVRRRNIGDKEMTDRTSTTCLLGGLILTLIGAAIAAYGVILGNVDARALATMKWDFNQQLYESLLTQSRCAMWGLIIVAIGTAMQIIGTVFPLLARRRH
jgi:hypothetical protein